MLPKPCKVGRPKSARQCTRVKYVFDVSCSWFCLLHLLSLLCRNLVYTCMKLVCPTATSPATLVESKTPTILPKHEALSDLTNFESKGKAD